MLTKLNITDFRSIKYIDLEFKPVGVTLLFGQNNSDILDATHCVINRHIPINPSDCNNPQTTRLNATFKGEELSKSCSYIVFNQNTPHAIGMGYYNETLEAIRPFTTWFNENPQYQPIFNNLLKKILYNITGFHSVQYECNGLSLNGNTSISLLDAPLELQMIVAILGEIVYKIFELNSLKHGIYTLNRVGGVFLINNPDKIISFEIARNLISTLITDLPKCQVIISTHYPDYYTGLLCDKISV